MLVNRDTNECVAVANASVLYLMQLSTEDKIIIEHGQGYWRKENVNLLPIQGHVSHWVSSLSAVQRRIREFGNSGDM